MQRFLQLVSIITFLKLYIKGSTRQCIQIQKITHYKILSSPSLMNDYTSLLPLCLANEGCLWSLHTLALYKSEKREIKIEGKKICNHSQSSYRKKRKKAPYPFICIGKCSTLYSTRRRIWKRVRSRCQMSVSAGSALPLGFFPPLTTHGWLLFYFYLFIYFLNEGSPTEL